MKTPKAKKLPSGSWFVRVRINGQDIGITRPTEKEAVAEAMSVKANIISAKKNPAAMTLRAAYDAYIEDSTSRCSPSTIAGYRRLQKNTFQSLMSRQLKSITNEAVQREINAMARTGKTPKYISNAVGLLSPVLRDFAPGFKLEVTLPKKRKPDLRMPTDAEIQQIMAAVRGDRVELPVLMALWMGMRMSEVRGVKFRDIQEGRLHICRAIVDGEDGQAVEKGTKTYSGDRWVEIPEYILSLIPQGNPNDHIVSMSGQAIYKRFSRVLEGAGITHCRFHDLRRANAAAMIRLGIDSKYAQERNGWATDHMYKQVYGYVMTDRMREQAAAIDDYFGGKMAAILPPECKNGNENGIE